MTEACGGAFEGDTALIFFAEFGIALKVHSRRVRAFYRHTDHLHSRIERHTSVLGHRT